MYTCIRRRFTCASFTPRYPQLLAKCLHALFEANVHEILVYSRIPLERRQIAYACDLRVYVDVYTRNNTRVYVREFVPFPLFFSKG